MEQLIIILIALVVVNRGAWRLVNFALSICNSAGLVLSYSNIDVALRAQRSWLKTTWLLHDLLDQVLVLNLLNRGSR